MTKTRGTKQRKNETSYRASADQKDTQGLSSCVDYTNKQHEIKVPPWSNFRYHFFTFSYTVGLPWISCQFWIYYEHYNARFFHFWTFISESLARLVFPQYFSFSRAQNLLKLNIIPVSNSTWKTSRILPTFAIFKIRRTHKFSWTYSFLVVVLQRTAKKCTKICNARAQALPCSLNLLFGGALFAATDVICLKTLANEDSLLRTHCCRHKCFPVYPRAHFESGTQKMFLILFRNILCPQQVFPSLRSPRNITGNNVSATMRPRLPGPLSSILSNKATYIRRKEWRPWSSYLLYMCNFLHQLPQHPEWQVCNCCFELPHSIFPPVVRPHPGFLSLYCRSDHTSLRIVRSWLYRQLEKSFPPWWCHFATFRSQHL